MSGRKWMLGVSVVVLLYMVSVSQAVPAWYLQRMAAPDMIVGKGSAAVTSSDEGDALSRAKQAALHDACASIVCHVSAETTLVQKETQADIEDLFVSEVAVRTAVQAVRATTLQRQLDSGTAYVAVGLPRAELRESYKKRVRGTLRRVQEDFKLAETLRRASPRRAVAAYERCIVHISEMDAALKVYLLLNGWEHDLVDEMGTVVAAAEVEARLASLVDVTPKRPEDLADALLDSLELASDARREARSFAIYPLEYEQTGFVSDFGYALTELLANGITQRTGWKRHVDARGADAVLRGRILASGKGACLVLSMSDSSGEQSGRVYASERTCRDIGWSRIRPKGLDKALQDKLNLYQSLQSDDGLRIQLQTDRMTDGPVVYRYGDRPRLALKASRACYVRLIYVFSDGEKALLLDNYRISDDLANEWQRLPLNWEVCAPPGVEQMLVQATVDQKMPFLNVKRRSLPDGYYQDIIVETLSEAVVKTRGGKHFKTDPILTEIPYQWTIFKE